MILWLTLGWWISWKSCLNSKASHHRCSCKKLFWKYAVNLQENTHTEVNLNKVFAPRRGCSPVYLLHIFRTHFPMNTFGGLLLLVLYSQASKYLELLCLLWFHCKISIVSDNKAQFQRNVLQNSVVAKGC